MEEEKQQEKLPITEEQIKEFLGLYKRFSGKGKTVVVEEKETTFKSYMDDGVYCINAKNEVLNTTLKYDPKTGIISSFDDQKGIKYKHYSEGDGPLDFKRLQKELDWYQGCVPPSLGEKLKKGISNVTNGLTGVFGSEN